MILTEDLIYNYLSITAMFLIHYNIKRSLHTNHQKILSLVVSNHTNSFDFIYWGFEISTAETSGATPIQNKLIKLFVCGEGLNFKSSAGKALYRNATVT